jgi:hypothetical protein
MDYSSNRYLVSSATPGEGAYLTLNASLKRSTPTFDIALQPMLSLQRYSTGSGSNSDNRSINASAAWTRELSTWSLLGGYSDLSTLTTELATTGVVQGNTRQRQETGQGSWQLQHSETAALNVQIAYARVNYVGQQGNVLSNYQYPSVSIGEKFKLRPATSLSVTASGSDLLSPNLGDSQDYELNLALEHSFSEHLSLSTSVGRSQQYFKTRSTSPQLASSASSHGYVGEFRLTRVYERNQWKISYHRAVTPNGFGGLVQRDQGSLSVLRDLAPRLTGNVGLFTTRDREEFQFASLQLGRRYESMAAGLNWLSGETSSFGIRVSTDRATVTASSHVPAAKGWQAALTYTWTPLPGSASR